MPEPGAKKRLTTSYAGAGPRQRADADVAAPGERAAGDPLQRREVGREGAHRVLVGQHGDQVAPAQTSIGATPSASASPAGGSMRRGMLAGKSIR